ncbi:hypothetical protein V9K67_26615 [Paraflavisolibacter sp. H34]|uniref:hypothetical protein n=1 Tax=Huijunlia imazamoxiresistens TaxID=3127457 RepID=UPI003016F42E
MLLNLLLNKAVLIKRVNPEKPGKQGDLVLNDKEIYAYFLWGQKRYDLDQIEQIRIYWDSTLGLEELWCIDIRLPDGKAIYLDGSVLEHQRVTNDLLSALGREIVAFKDIPMKGDDLDLVYQKGMQPT